MHQIMPVKKSFNRQNRLRQLRAFCNAAQTGSISKAADRLNLSQPSISLQIQSLEKELNTLLFERKGPKILLTPAGRLLLEMAQPLVEGMDKLPDLFSAKMGEVKSGTLDIASGESTLLYLLPKFVKLYSDKFPQINVRLHNVTGRDGMSKIREDDVDFAVGSMIDNLEDLVYKPIFNFEPTLITPRGHPLALLKNPTPQDISPYGLILPPRHLSTWGIVDLVFQQHNIPYKVILEAGGWEVIKRYVEIGMGISIVTSICLREKEDNLETITLNDYFPKRSYGVVIRRGKFLSPQAKQFLEIMNPGFFNETDTKLDTNHGIPASNIENSLILP